jgi:hypothetical protein
MTISKTKAELETMIMERLQGNVTCAGLLGVVVSPDGDDGGWSFKPRVRSDAMLSADCERASRMVAQDLRRDFDLSAETFVPPARSAGWRR